MNLKKLAKKLPMIFATGLLGASLWLPSVSPAYAQAKNSGVSDQFRHQRRPHVPEIDPSLAVSGLAMLGGGILLVADRFRRRRAQ